jgi:hypothetical protein
MRKDLSSIRHWTVRILCALALVFVGFGSQPDLSEAGDLTPAELAQYQLPDGSFPILCITYKDADGKIHGNVHAPCSDTCQMVTAVLVPQAPATSSVHRPFIFANAIAPKADVFHRQLYPPSGGPRAPPTLAILA